MQPQTGMDSQNDTRSGTERSLAGKIGAFESWAATANRSQRTRPGRDAFRAKMERDVRAAAASDASEADIAQMLEAKWAAHFHRMGLLSVAARRRNKADRLRAAAEALERQAGEVV